MKRKFLALAALLAACALLAGCGAEKTPASQSAAASAGSEASSITNSSPAASAPETVQPPSDIDPDSPLAAVDFTVFAKSLTEADYQALQEYLPVLHQEREFSWQLEPYRPEAGEIRSAVLSDFPAQWSDDSASGLTLNCLTVLDLDGDGTAELLLCFENIGGEYLILHREGDLFYGTDRVYRGLENLQQNGVFQGSNGADDNFWARLSFGDGQFEEQQLASAVDSVYEIDGKSASQAEFDAWTAENLTGSAVWYGPDGKRVDFPLSS